MKKTNKNFGTAKVGFWMHLVMAILVALITISFVTGMIHMNSQLLRTILTLVSIGILAYLSFNVADCWRSWRAGTTTMNATSAASATTPVAPATATAAPTTTSAAPTIAPATPAPTPAAPKKITRAYLQQQAALVDDRMVEAEEVYEAAEQLQDEYMADKSDYEQKLAKAKARRLPPQQP